MSNAKRLVLAGGVLALAAIFGVMMVTQSKHAAYVRETLSILPQAEAAYAVDNLPDATKKVADASARRKVNPTWFEAADGAKIDELEKFLADQVVLSGQIATAAAKTAADPAKARAELFPLAEKARTGLPRTKPVSERADAALIIALDKERVAVEAAALKRIPEALKSYELGNWDGYLAILDEIHKTVVSLPVSSQAAATAAVGKGLESCTELTKLIAGMRSIRDGKDEGPVKADKLRDMVRKLPDGKGRDAALYRDLMKLIVTVDPETRPAVAATKLRASEKKRYSEAFTKDNGLQIVGDTSDLSLIELQGPLHHYAIRYVGSPAQCLIEVDRIRIQFDFKLTANREARCVEIATTIAESLRGNPRARAEEAWIVKGDAPGTCAVSTKDQAVWAVVDGRWFEGKLAADVDLRDQIAALQAAAKALETAVLASAGVPDEMKGPVAAFLRASHTRAPPNDYLDGEFCREVVQAGYLERHLPTMDADVAAALKEYRKMYEDLVLFRPRFDATSGDKATLLYSTNWEGDTLWRLVDPKTTTTSFSSIPRDGMNTDLVVQSVFAGAHEKFPTDAEPVEVRMFHGGLGVVSRWKDGKFDFDAKLWTSAVASADHSVTHPHFGTGDWAVPPHALKVNARGQGRELLLPGGALKIEDFTPIAAGPARREAQEKFLNLCAERMKSPGELHLFFRYFIQYVLDSPVTTAPTLIGSSRHSGDCHQDAYQTLDRSVIGKFLCDCDDLAELYWNIQKRQGKLAYVLGVPGHATCGVAEKEGDGWKFHCVDTGPPRIVKGADLDQVVEKLLRTYDVDGSMPFDPRQMRFLFRFAGEQTRTDYYLDSRILRDAPYAETMINVQECWHFGFYARGIEMMNKLLQTDAMPANCQEIAGLYTRVGMFEESLTWTQNGIKGLDAKDHLSRLSETLRISNCLRQMKKKDEAVKALIAAGDEIASIIKANPREGNRYRSLRFQVAGALASNGHPWDGWALVKDEVIRLVAAGYAAESLMAMVTEVYSKMKDEERKGTELTDKQTKDMEKVGSMLETFVRSGLFKADDSNMELLGKYALLFGYYVAVDGPEKAFPELLKAEYPTEKRKHTARKNSTPELDWKWIRLSPYAYAASSGHALDKESPKGVDPKAACEHIKALVAALPEMNKQGSLGPVEFAVLDLRLLGACLEMDEAALKGIFEEMNRQAWGQLYEDLSRTLGRAAAFMTVENFEKVFRMYCEFKAPRRHYYGVVYGALAAEARGHALAISKICIEKFPQDADMKREHDLLQKLVK